MKSLPITHRFTKTKYKEDIQNLISFWHRNEKLTRGDSPCCNRAVGEINNGSLRRNA